MASVASMFKNSPAFSGFSVDDLAVAKAFYADLLGLSVSEVGQQLEKTPSAVAGLLYRGLEALRGHMR